MLNTSKKKWLWLLWVAFGIIIIGLIWWRLTAKAHAWHGCDCNYPTPTLSVSVEPSILPSVLPSESPTAGASATLVPQNNGGGGTGGTTPASAPAPATCNIPFDKPSLFGFKLGQNSGDVVYIWFDAQPVDKFSIIYGYDVNNLPYGEDNIPGDVGPVRSITLHGLQPGRNVWAVVGAWRGGCEEESQPLDPIVL